MAMAEAFVRDLLSTQEPGPQLNCLPLQKLCDNGNCVSFWSFCPQGFWLQLLHKVLYGVTCFAIICCVLYIVYYFSHQHEALSRPGYTGTSDASVYWIVPPSAALMAAPPSYEEVIVPSSSSFAEQLPMTSEEGPSTAPPSYGTVCPDFPSQSQEEAAASMSTVSTT